MMEEIALTVVITLLLEMRAKLGKNSARIFALEEKYRQHVEQASAAHKAIKDPNK